MAEYQKSDWIEAKMFQVSIMQVRYMIWGASSKTADVSLIITSTVGLPQLRILSQSIFAPLRSHSHKTFTVRAADVHPYLAVAKPSH